jgi:hypothetical protein
MIDRQLPTEPKKKVRRKNYINNETFHESMVEWKEQLKTDPKTRIPNYIGECFIKLAEGRARHPWHSGWTFKDEMIAEAVLTCCKYAHNYNPEKSNNPFSYFTQFVNNAFSQIKLKEKKLSDYKFEQVKENQQNSEGFDYNNFFSDEG